MNWAGAHVAGQAKITSSAKFLIGGRLDIGEETWIGHEVLFVGGISDVRIGKQCDIAPRVVFATGSHEIRADEVKAAGVGFSSPIEIGDGCWIGVGATILGGTKIGKTSIVAAGAVVRGDFPSGVVIGGVPARVIEVVKNKVKKSQ